MKAKILSPSSIDRYLNCPKSLKLYIDRVQQRPSSSGNVGTVFHLGMEAYVDYGYKMPFKEALHQILYEENKAYPPAIINEAVEIAEEWLKLYPMPPKEDIHATEISFGPPGTTLAGKKVKSEVSFESGLQLRGIIDLVWIDNGTIVVGDYKTQKSWLTPDELSTKIQAMAYALVVHQFNEAAPIRVEFYLVRYPENGPVVWVPQDEDFAEMEQILWNYQRIIRNDKLAEANPGMMCRWCSYNYMCQEYKDWAHVNGDPEMWETMDIDTLVDELEDWYSRHKASEDTYKDIKMRAKLVMERDNINKVGRWSLTRRMTTSYRDEVAGEVAGLGGRSKLTSDKKAELKPYEVITWGEPTLQCNWREKRVKK